jgi:rubrerythrin
MLTPKAMVERWSKFKASEKIPAAGRYKCIVCALIIEIPESFVKDEKTFFSCPICHAGDEGGPKGPQDRVWEFLW